VRQTPDVGNDQEQGGIPRVGILCQYLHSLISSTMQAFPAIIELYGFCVLALMLARIVTAN